MMEEWKEYKLGDLCSISSSKRIFANEYQISGIPFYRGKEIIEKQKGEPITNELYISEDRFNEIRDKYGTPQKGEMLLTSVGTSGIPYIVKDEKFYFKDGNLTWFYNFRGINNVYLYYWFLSPAAQYLINAKAIGSTQKALTIETLKKFDLLLPPIDIQKKVVAILKSLDDKIEVNRKINANLEQQAQALFKSWFVDFEPFKDGEFVESELGMIPKGWRVGILDELCSFISRGLTPKYDETSEELILGQTCVRNNIVTLNNARKHRPKTKNDKWVQQWDVLLNSTGIGSLGRVGIVYFNMDNVAIDSHITVVRTSCSLYRHYVGRNLLSRQLEIENMAVGSTGQTELPRDRVKAMPIIIPSHDALDKFNAIIESMAISMYSNIMESRRLATLRDTLLPKLMSGELKVNEIKA